MTRGISLHWHDKWHVAQAWLRARCIAEEDSFLTSARCTGRFCGRRRRRTLRNISTHLTPFNSLACTTRSVGLFCSLACSHAPQYAASLGASTHPRQHTCDPCLYPAHQRMFGLNEVQGMWLSCPRRVMPMGSRRVLSSRHVMSISQGIC